MTAALVRTLVGIPSEFLTQVSPVTRRPAAREYTERDFARIRDLGSGTFGNVYLVETKEKTTLVVKMIPRTSVDEREVENEVRVLQYLQPYCQGGYVVCFDDFLADEHNYYIVTEYLGSNYMDLQDFIDAHHDEYMRDPDAVMTLVCALTVGLLQIHSAGVAHRDVKPGNVLVDEKNYKRIKYIDFGVACIDDDCKQFRPGTAQYMSPELLLPNSSQVFGLEEAQKADIWALGMTIFTLLARESYWTLYYIKYLRATKPPALPQLTDLERRVPSSFLKQGVNIDGLLPNLSRDFPLLYRSLQQMLSIDVQTRGVPEELIAFCSKKRKSNANGRAPS